MDTTYQAFYSSTAAVVFSAGNAIVLEQTKR